jgi:hypothetical protein
MTGQALVITTVAHTVLPGVEASRPLPFEVIFMRTEALRVIMFGAEIARVGWFGSFKCQILSVWLERRLSVLILRRRETGSPEVPYQMGSAET